MKNKKFKLFASLTSLVMVVAVMAVGVWAATTASVGITTTASFSASGFDAKITLLKDGTTAHAGTTANPTAVPANDVVVLENILTSSNQDAKATVYVALPFEDTDDSGFIDTEEFTVKFKIDNLGQGADFKYTVNVQAASVTTGAYLTATPSTETKTVETSETVTITYKVANHTDGKAFTLDDDQMPTVSIVLGNV